jgi:hypothetical protein
MLSRINDIRRARGTLEDSSTFVIRCATPTTVPREDTVFLRVSRTGGGSWVIAGTHPELFLRRGPPVSVPEAPWVLRACRKMCGGFVGVWRSENASRTDAIELSTAEGLLADAIPDDVSRDLRRVAMACERRRSPALAGGHAMTFLASVVRDDGTSVVPPDTNVTSVLRGLRVLEAELRLAATSTTTTHETSVHPSQTAMTMASSRGSTTMAVPGADIGGHEDILAITRGAAESVVVMATAAASRSRSASKRS